MKISEVVVWVPLLIVAYVYLGYPLFLAFLVKWRPREIQHDEIVPHVTMFISVFNEEGIIREKLENTLALKYPPSELQVIVISDASTDHTDEIVVEFSSQGVTLLRLPKRCGKSVGLNQAVTMARGDILLFSDANIMYRSDTIHKLVRNFADSTVGCVTGDSRYLDPHETTAGTQENIYWSYERIVRKMESQIGSTVGGDGAIFSIRRELFRHLLPESINDLVIPLQIVARGHRAIFEADAVGFEPLSGSFSREFRRKRRIVNRSWAAIFGGKTGVSLWTPSQFTWQVWSHKILRWLSLPLLAITAVGSFLSYQEGLIYQIGAWGVLLGCLLAVNRLSSGYQ